jgi:hypothetical protein
MDFSSRGFQRNNETKPTGTTVPTNAGAPTGLGEAPKPANQKPVTVDIKHNKPLLILAVLLSVSLLVLSVATIAGIGTASKTAEKDFVNTDLYQAVFIDGSQLPYFGKIVDLNNRYVVLEDIFYLNVTTGSVQPGEANAANQQVSLVRLGCSELHLPQNQMIINRENVQFWENLESKGKVATAIKEWKDAGGKCETTTDNADTNTTAPTEEDETDTTNNTNTSDNTDTNP